MFLNKLECLSLKSFSGFSNILGRVCIGSGLIRNYKTSNFLGADSPLVPVLPDGLEPSTFG
jgi:hypothetical protein